MRWATSEATTASAVVVVYMKATVHLLPAHVQVGALLSRAGGVGCCNACHVGYYQRHKTLTCHAPRGAGHPVTAGRCKFPHGFNAQARWLVDRPLSRTMIIVRHL